MYHLNHTLIKIMKLKINNNKINIKKIVSLLAAALFILCILPFVSGCSVSTLIEESYQKEVLSDKLPYIKIDEKEIESISASDREMKKNYEFETDISIVENNIRDPFEPFYIDKEELEEKNVLILEKIYREDGVSYAEINFNNITYKQKKGDVFGNNNYRVEAINPTSVVLLKGDEIITIFIDQIFYD